MNQALKDSYKAIPPTTDPDYWKSEILDAKTRRFILLDPQLHLALLITRRQTMKVVRLTAKGTIPIK